MSSTPFVTQYLPPVKVTKAKSKLSEKFKHKATPLALHFLSAKDSLVMAKLKSQSKNIKNENKRHHHTAAEN